MDSKSTCPVTQKMPQSAQFYLTLVADDMCLNGHTPKITNAHVICFLQLRTFVHNAHVICFLHLPMSLNACAKCAD